jgi:hypothetical protein
MRREVRDYAVHVPTRTITRQQTMEEFAGVSPESHPVKGAQMRAAKRSKTLDRMQFRQGKSTWPKWHFMPLGMKENPKTKVGSRCCRPCIDHLIFVGFRIQIATSREHA